MGLESCNRHDAHRWVGALDMADSILRSRLEKVWDVILESMRGEHKRTIALKVANFAVCNKLVLPSPSSTILELPVVIKERREG